MKRPQYSLLSLLLVIFLGSSCLPEPYEAPIDHPPFEDLTMQDTCNGHPELCAMRFNEVTYATTNKSYNYESGPVEFQYPNQSFHISRQLKDGIRALNLDVMKDGGDLVVYHQYNFLGSESFADILDNIATFVNANPNEVITLFLNSDVSGLDIEVAFEAAGLAEMVHTQGVGDWPTLGEMIESGKKMVVFTSNIATAGNPEWFHYVWDHVASTSNDLMDSGDLNCNISQGSATNSLFQLNHWVSDEVGILGFPVLTPIGDQGQAATLNVEAVLLARAQDCTPTDGQVNFLSVDFYGEGDLFKVVDILNGVGE